MARSATEDRGQDGNGEDIAERERTGEDYNSEDITAAKGKMGEKESRGMQSFRAAPKYRGMLPYC